MREIPTWQAYDRIAASGEYGELVNEAGELTLSPDGRREADFFRSALEGRKRVLDVGCGPGFPLIMLTDCVTTLYGVDASPAMLAAARRNVAALGMRSVVLLRALGEQLPFLNGVFDGFAICGTLGSLPEPAAVLSELARVGAPGAMLASIEQDYRRRLAPGAPRVERWLCTQAGALWLRVVRYLTDPYRIRDERYVLYPASDFGRRVLGDPELVRGERKATDLSPEHLPPEVILDAWYSIEAQFDPDTLQAALDRAGFEPVKQWVADSYGVPHIFSVFRCR